MVAGTLALARAHLRNKGRLNIANIPKQTNPFATSVSTAGEEPTTMAALSFVAQTGVSVLLRASSITTLGHEILYPIRWAAHASTTSPTMIR